MRIDIKHISEIDSATPSGVVRVLAEVDLVSQDVKFYYHTLGTFAAVIPTLVATVLNGVSEWRSQQMSDACDEYDAMGLPDGEDTDTGVLDELYAKHGVDDLLYTFVCLEIYP